MNTIRAMIELKCALKDLRKSIKKYTTEYLFFFILFVIAIGSIVIYEVVL